MGVYTRIMYIEWKLLIMKKAKYAQGPFSDTVFVSTYAMVVVAGGSVLVAGGGAVISIVGGTVVVGASVVGAWLLVLTVV